MRVVLTTPQLVAAPDIAASITPVAVTRLLTAFKPHAGELVLGWVPTSESSLLYVFGLFSYRACERSW